MAVPEIDYIKVKSPQEAVRMLRQFQGDAKILAGGTDLILQLQHGKEKAGHLVSLRGIAELQKITASDQEIKLGCGVTHRQVETSELMAKELQALQEGASQVGSVQIRNVATVTGNICNGAPSADTAAPLLALGARLKVLGPDGEKEVPLNEFYLGPGRTVLKDDEMVLEFIIPRPPQNSASRYCKVSRRNAMDLALMGVAVYLKCASSNSVIEDVRIAMNTVAPTPIRAYRTENFLKGKFLDERILYKAGEVAVEESLPRTSWRSSAEYRKEMIKVYLRRTLIATYKEIKKEV
ncbi:MAG: FAD binding domain-containing protein [Dehalobacterium sp.]